MINAPLPDPIPPEIRAHMRKVEQIARQLNESSELVKMRRQITEMMRPAMEAMELTRPSRELVESFRRSQEFAQTLQANHELIESFRRKIPDDQMQQAREVFGALARQVGEMPRFTAEFNLEVSDPETAPPPLTLKQLGAIILAWVTMDSWAPQLQQQNMAEWGRTLLVLALVLVAVAMADTDGDA